MSQAVSDIKQIYHSNNGRDLADKDAEIVACALASLRDTAKYIHIAPRHVFQFVFASKDFYGKCYYPCDVIQLRQILEDGCIRSLSKTIMFSHATAKKLIKSYKCLLILDIDPHKMQKQIEGASVLIAGGMLIVNAPKIDISDKIRGVIIQKGAPADVIQKIVYETLPSCPIHQEFPVPGVDREKFAALNKDLKKFVINLPAMNINHTLIMARDEFMAVQEALDKKWNHSPAKQMSQRKPANYTAEYWMRSGFWDSIVHPERAMREAQNNGPQITLTPEEQQIFSLIMNIDKEFGLGCTYYVAGGWCRDKLLGKDSDDIDIAMDKLTGAQFYGYATQYARKYPNSGIGKSYTVDLNIEKSKHLETVAVEILGRKIDFVNLRSENYGDDSRIPTVEFGTPEIDAQRRDLTINGLLYNINVGKIEDYVGGLKDLETMTLRTPLDPVKTFTDDPLRMLRALRFNARYPGSVVSPEIFKAMADPRVQEAYRTKVAPERASPEIYKMLAGQQASVAVRAMFATGLDKAIFDVPETKNLLPLTMDQKNKHHRYNLLEHTLQTVDALQKIMHDNKIPEQERVLMLVAAIFHDYGKAVPGIGQPKEKDPNEYGYVGHEDESAKIAESVLKRIGFGKQDRDFVGKVVSEHMRPHMHNNDWTNKSMGRWLKDLEIPGQEHRTDMWKYVFWHAQADTIAHGHDPADELAKKQESWNNFDAYINSPKPIVMKPLIDGFELQKMFPNLSVKPVVKGGMSYLKDVQNRLMDEQLAGNITDIDQARAFIESLRPEIEGKYMQPKQAKNWYDFVKMADASSGTDPGSYTGWDDTPNGQREDEKHMIRRFPGVPSLYSVGDRVRQRTRGFADEQIYGKIVSKKHNIMKVKWEGSKKTDTFDINDVSTTLMLERI